ncbi:MAG: S-layer family protein [Cyanobacteria bacterium J06582_2]
MIFQRKYLDLIFTVIVVTEIFIPAIAKAQIIPDATLGTESSIVAPPSRENRTPNPPENREQLLIKGGAVRDSNLFHSFSEFNINNGQQVNFANPEGIANILTRVTGNNASNIFGALGIDGDANLFLINPNGIVFGENANINLNGAFFASTAEQIDFADGNSFSAVNPTAPLLTIDIPLGVQLGNNPAPIEADKATINGGDITLLGGDISLKQTNITASGGTVRLDSLATAGTVNFDRELPVDLARGDIRISDRSNIDVMDAGGGNVIVNSRNLTLTGDSHLKTGIKKGLGASNTVAGNIYLNATNDIYFRESSSVTNTLEENSLGNGGNIEISTRNLTIEDSEDIFSGSKIEVSTLSSGNTGNIKINASEELKLLNHAPLAPFALLPGDAPSNAPQREKGGIFSSLQGNSSGNGGMIEIDTQNITIDGNIRIFSHVQDNSTGKGGAIAIDTERLFQADSGSISAHTSSLGDGGTINITATEGIELIGIKPETLKTFVTANPEPGARPQVTSVGAVVTMGETQGNGGQIDIQTKDLVIRDGAIITVNTFSAGNGGNINIQASDRVIVSGQGAANFPSGIGTAAGFNSSGNGGSLSIDTGSLFIEGGAGINARTIATGDGGAIFIRASSIELAEGELGKINSINAQVEKDASGRGGNIYLETDNLTILDGSQISAATLGTGAGGNVELNVSESLRIEGSIPIEKVEFPLRGAIIDPVRNIIPSGVFASSPGLGNADAIAIETDNLSLARGAQISVSSQKQGAAGDLSIKADNIINLDRSILSAETVEGDRANIILNTSNLQLSDRSLITTNAKETATGGNIAIDTDILLAVDNSDITANAEDNFGGRVFIEAQGIFGTAIRNKPTPQSDITASSRLGAEFSGVVEIDLSNADPAKGIIKLPDNVIDASQQITSSCNFDSENTFVVTGRGGIAPSPQEFLRGQNILQDWRVSSMDNTRGTADNERFSTNKKPSSIQEAEKWIVNPQGKIELVASGSKDSGDLWSQTVKCGSTS